MTPSQIARIWPLPLALFVALVAWFFANSLDMQKPPFAVPGATMTLGIVVSGFVAAQRNMLLPMVGSRVLRFAVRTGYYKDIVTYLMDCILAGLLLTGFSLAAFFLGDCSLLWQIWFTGLGGLVALVVFLIVRNEILMGRVIRQYLADSVG